MNILFLTVMFLVEHANSFLLCMLFLLMQFDTVRSTNEWFLEANRTGMVLVSSKCLWFNQFPVLELVQHEQRPQDVFRRNFDFYVVQHYNDFFWKSSKVSQIEKTILSFSLASHTSNALMPCLLFPRRDFHADFTSNTGM